VNAASYDPIDVHIEIKRNKKTRRGTATRDELDVTLGPSSVRRRGDRVAARGGGLTSRM